MIESLPKKYMQRAFSLALLGKGKVAPNPLVGCVIVKNDKIIGEGWHQQYGQAHAEVNAVNSVKNQEDIQGATVYVSLEPCSHFGKTPPCVDLLLKLKPKKVWISNQDPNPLVAGRGIQKLREAHIEVEQILEEEGYEINKRFFTFFEKKRPYIILKWAETANAMIARNNYDSKWISNPLARKLVHQWRSQEAGIMVGTNTAHYDNPKLNVRHWTGKSPTRIVIDKNLRLDKRLHLFDKSQKTICYNFLKNAEESNLSFVKIDNTNILEQILTNLYQRKIQSILVEGGTTLLNSFIEHHLWDEARVFKSKAIFREGIKAPTLYAPLIQVEEIQDNLYFEYRNSHLFSDSTKANS